MSLWHALESIDGLAAGEIEWRDVLGPDWEWAESLLRRTGETVESVFMAGEVHRVVVHAPNRVVAVPECGGSAKPIERDHIEVLRLDWRQFSKWVLATLGFKPGEGKHTGGGLARDIGRVQVTPGTICPVHFCAIGDPALREAAVYRLLAEQREPSIILIPDSALSPETHVVVRYCSGCVLRLADAIAPSRAHPTRTNVAERQLADFAVAVEHWEKGVHVEDPFRYEQVGKNVWCVAFNRQRGFVTETKAKGLRYIQHLLARPHQQIDVNDLEEMVTGDTSLGAPAFGSQVVNEEDLPGLRKALRELKEDRQIATDDADHAEVAKLSEKIGKLEAYIGSARGFNDRVRLVGDDLERLRSRLSNAIVRAIEVIGDEVTPLGTHLENAINRGKTMSYTPDSPIPWVFGQSGTSRVPA